MTKNGLKRCTLEKVDYSIIFFFTSKKCQYFFRERKKYPENPGNNFLKIREIRKLAPGL